MIYHIHLAEVVNHQILPAVSYEIFRQIWLISIRKIDGLIEKTGDWRQA